MCECVLRLASALIDLGVKKGDRVATVAWNCSEMLEISPACARVEKYLRDTRIFTIWEGTSFIQAMDLVGRKMAMKNGKLFENWMATIREFIDANRNADGFEKEMGKLARGYQCIEDVRATYNSWYNHFEAKRTLIPFYALKALFVCAQVQVAECLMEQALIAKKKLAEVPRDAVDTIFYGGKIACARYYANNILPNVFLITEIIKEEDDSVTICLKEAFMAGYIIPFPIQ